MDHLFEQFIKERRYFRNLSERTLHFYTETYNYFKQVGAFDDLSKQLLQSAVIVFRQRGQALGNQRLHTRRKRLSEMVTPRA
jgi:predicted house-cleaning NTP pyrophosphatase (Maf/HAM1 superfamily)